MRSFKFQWSYFWGVTFTACVIATGLSSFVTHQALADAGLFKQVQPSDAWVKKGQQLFLKNNCNSCHGEQGKGDGLAAAALNPKPRNFHVNTGWKNGTSFAGLYKTLEEGIPGGPMSSYAHIPAADRVAIIHYIRSLNKSIYPDLSETEVSKLDQQYGLSKALASSGKSRVIPVDLAMEKLVAEAAAERKKIDQALALIEQHRNEPGGRLFAAVTYDSTRALTLLTHSRIWKDNVTAFAKVVLAEAAYNGFKARVGTLSQKEWLQLFDYLKKIL